MVLGRGFDSRRLHQWVRSLFFIPSIAESSIASMKTGIERSALLVAVESEHTYRRVRFNSNTLAPAASTKSLLRRLAETASE